MYRVARMGAMRSKRRREIDLYKKYASDDDFKKGMHDALLRLMEHVRKDGAANQTRHG